LVVDPVLRAGGGAKLAEEALIDVYRRELFPLATLVTPNVAESHRLATGSEDLAACAAAFLATGAGHILIKGADEDTLEVHNALFSQGHERQDFHWPRLPGTYHGSGCTLASAIAALLARGQPLPQAVEAAQRYTWQALKDGWQLGPGQRIPNRWSRQ
jgi:hydroxymethylpyrimidine/phosphomethylpyrimidine kinase